jgi:hypothetical protein
MEEVSLDDAGDNPGGFRATGTNKSNTPVTCPAKIEKDVFRTKFCIDRFCTLRTFSPGGRTLELSAARP